jgi:predicted ABC-class ATPase
MAIRAGVTLVVGGGFHGKSTLLRALELGCYDHVPGDGREFVVCDPTAVKIRAEDGRGVERVDISPFISNLPFGKRTDAFSTPDASGSTSQAANIMEALEVGCEVLLIDEDTAATNFMIRSAEMRRLVSPEKEPITPFIAKVRALADVGPDPDVTGPGPGPGPGDGASGVTPPTGVTPRRVSSILVLGGSGDYFAVADTVICMENYAPRDVTAEAAAIARDALRARADAVHRGGARGDGEDGVRRRRADDGGGARRFGGADRGGRRDGRGRGHGRGPGAAAEVRDRGGAQSPARGADDAARQKRA